MKKTFVLVLTALSWTGMMAQESQDVQKYFEATFQNRSLVSRAAPSEKVRRDELKTAKEEVWNEWKSFVRSLDEPCLPAEVSLDSPAVGRLAIPDSLEPSAVMPFYWGVKGNLKEKASISAPTFVDIHGSGPKDIEWRVTWQWAKTFADAPSRYFIPQIPSEQHYRWYLKGKQWAYSWFWRHLTTETSADVDRVCILGVSEGGYGSQRLASFYADYLAAAGPMAGGEPLINAPAENLGHIGFSLMTGEKDFMFCRDRYTRFTGQALDSLAREYPGEYEHRVQLIEGRGHGLDYSPTTPWLMKFKRNPRPRHFIWEDYDMDGIHRNGFYNLRVDKRPNDTIRVRYDVDVKDNGIIDIQARLVEYVPLEKENQWGFTLRWDKKYTPATGGRLTLFLDENLGGLDKKVVVRVNGRTVYKGKLKTDKRWMRESVALFGDPQRIFPAAVSFAY